MFKKHILPTSLYRKCVANIMRIRQYIHFSTKYEKPSSSYCVMWNLFMVSWRGNVKLGRVCRNGMKYPNWYLIMTFTQIREARRSRVPLECDGGVTIRLRIPESEMQMRTFRREAYFQVRRIQLYHNMYWWRLKRLCWHPNLSVHRPDSTILYSLGGLWLGWS